MDHAKGLALKSLLNGIPATYLLSTIGGLPVGNALIASLMLTFLAYIVGDLFVLPRSNGTVATALDAALALLILWSLKALGMPITEVGMIYTAVALTLVEWLVFHPYLHREVRRDVI